MNATNLAAGNPAASHGLANAFLFPVISVQFAAPVEIELPIKHHMKTLSHISEPLPILPTFFEMVGRRHISAYARKNASVSGVASFVDLMLDEKKLQAVLEMIENRESASCVPPPCSPPTKNHDVGFSEPRRTELKQVEFSLAAPLARSVQLAADFTDWEKSAIDLIKANDGVWFTFIPLSSGRYLYRFIVDGQWHDPYSQRNSNPFGELNGIKIVA